KELMFLLQLVYYGEILLPTPCWVSYGPQAKIIGRNVRLIHTTREERWRISPQRLRRYLDDENDFYRPRLLILNYPGNPDGDTYTMEELQEIAEIAREYEIILLSDEIYGQLAHSGGHFSIARFYPEGTIISSGLSKWCGAGGWRLGTFTFPKQLRWLMDAMAIVASETYTSVSAPIQYAAIQAFIGGSEIEEYLWHARRILKLLGLEIAKTLQQGNIKTNDPTGGFYLFLDFSDLSEKLAARGILSGTELCNQLLKETGVAILPGEDFNRPTGEISARLSYVDFDGAKAMSASRNYPLHDQLPEDFTKRWCGQVIEAVEKLVEWVNR